VVFADHLRPPSSPRNCAVPFLSTFLVCPTLSNKLYRFSSSKLHRSISWRTLVFFDWLESDFSVLSDAEEGALLSQVLIGLELNSVIEKSAKLVLSIYHGILDLKLASALEHLDPGLWEVRSGLITVFQVVRKEYNLDDTESSALASMLWLETHTGRLPCLLGDWAISQCHNMVFLYDKVLCPRDYGLHSFEGTRRKGIF
jgi:hypothetical protein